MPSQDHCASVVSKHAPRFGKVCGPNDGKAIVVVACCHPSQVEVCGFVRCCLFCIGCGCADATSTVVCGECFAMPVCCVSAVAAGAIVECVVAMDGLWYPTLKSV